MRRELVVFGVDQDRAPIDFRERIAYRGDDLPLGLDELGRIAGEGLILSTCNRTEVYAVVPGGETLRRFLAESRGVAEGDLDHVGYVACGPEAARHLYRVASGLESLVLGEPQILGQVRDALAAAHAAGTAGPVISRLATEALRVGKRARTETGLARSRLSVPHAAVDLAARRAGGLRGRSALVLGAGEMAALTAKLLRHGAVGDLLIANRTAERGRALAARTDGRFVPLSALAGVLPGVDLVFGATAAPTAVLDHATVVAALASRATPLVVVDLAVPRSIDPNVGDHPRVRLFDVDDLEAEVVEHRRRSERDVEQATAIVDEAVAAFAAWWRGREAAPAIAALRRHAEAVRSGELERALRKLGHLSPRDREVVQALSVGIVNKLLHEPITRLRDGGGAPAVEAARGLFGLDGDGVDPAERDEDVDRLAGPVGAGGRSGG